MEPIFSAIVVEPAHDGLRAAFERWATRVGASPGAGALADIRIDAAFSTRDGAACIAFFEPRGPLGGAVLMGAARAMARDVGAPLRLCIAGLAGGLSYRHYRVDRAGRFEAKPAPEADAFLLEHEAPDDGDVDWELFHELLVCVCGLDCSLEGAEHWSLPRPIGVARLDAIVLAAWSSTVQVSDEGDRKRIVLTGADVARRVTFVDAADWARIAPHVPEDG